jgi:hypothetical protein
LIPAEFSLAMMQSTIFFASPAFTPAVLDISRSSRERIAAESTSAPPPAAVEPEAAVDVVLEPADGVLELELAVDAAVELELPVDVWLEFELPHAETARAVRTAASSDKPLCERITTSCLALLDRPGRNAARSPERRLAGISSDVNPSGSVDSRRAPAIAEARYCEG